MAKDSLSRQVTVHVRDSLILREEATERTGSREEVQSLLQEITPLHSRSPQQSPLQEEIKILIPMTKSMTRRISIRMI